MPYHLGQQNIPDSRQFRSETDLSRSKRGVTAGRVEFVPSGPLVMTAPPCCRLPPPWEYYVAGGVATGSSAQAIPAIGLSNGETAFPNDR
jgi:hypothetical protein